jgi:hypothetical protein
VRARVGLGIALVFGMFSLVRGLDGLERGTAGVTPYGVVTARFNAAYEPLRERLPHHGTIGFVSATNDDLAYVLAHYAFAPSIVRHWPAESVVVAHVETPEAAEPFVARLRAGSELPPDAVVHTVVVPR